MLRKIEKDRMRGTELGNGKYAFWSKPTDKIF